MKTKNKFIAMALIAIIGIALISCSDGGGNPPPPTFTVTFHANGGTPEPAQQTIEKGTTATEPPAMTKTNSDFDGWYKESGFTTKWNFTTDTVTTNIDLHAKWTPYYGTLPNTTIKIYKGEGVTDEQMTSTIANITKALSKSYLMESESDVIKNNVIKIQVKSSGTDSTFEKENGKYTVIILANSGDTLIANIFYDILDEITGS